MACHYNACGKMERCTVELGYNIMRGTIKIVSFIINGCRFKQGVCKSEGRVI